MLSRLLLAATLPLTLAGVAGAEGEEKPFAPKGAGFSVMFPGAPTEHKQSIKTAAGTIDVTLYIFEPQKGKKEEGQFAVSFSQYPEEALKAGSNEERLKNARDGAVKSVMGKLKREKTITLSGHPGHPGHPGLDLHIVAKDGVVIHTRIFAVQNRLYQTMVLGPSKLVSSKDAERFLESFKLAK